jgi:hypothetical protein
MRAAVVLEILLIPSWCAATKWSDPRKTPHSTGGVRRTSRFPSGKSSAISSTPSGNPAYKVHDRTFVYVEDNNLDDSVTIVTSARERKISVTRGRQKFSAGRVLISNWSVSLAEMSASASALSRRIT